MARRVRFNLERFFFGTSRRSTSRRPSRSSSSSKRGR